MTRRRACAPDLPVEEGARRLRLDRWLWHVRAFRTRTLAVERIQSGGVRVNGQPCRKPGHTVAPGDVVTFPAGQQVLTYQVCGLGQRRGPAPEAAGLYRDMTTPAMPDGANLPVSAP